MSTEEMRAWARGYAIGVEKTIEGFSAEMLMQGRLAPTAVAPAAVADEYRTARPGYIGVQALAGEVVTALTMQIDALKKNPSRDRLKGKIDALTEAIGTVQDLVTHLESYSEVGLADLVRERLAAGMGTPL